MSPQQQRPAVRVLVDQFHDASRSELARFLTASGMQVTVLRRRLTAAALRRYHVLIISGWSPKRFTAAELRAIEQFVVEGGGLLLASSAPRFELNLGRPADQMPYQQVAARFGYRVLGADEAGGSPRVDRHFLRGFGREDARVTEGAPEGFGPHPPDLSSWLPIQAPDDAEPLLVHRRTGQPLAAMSRHGEGRVCVAGEPFSRVNALYHLAPLVRWLAGDATLRPGREVPDVFGPAPGHRSYAGMDIHYDATAEDALDDVLAIILRAREQVLKLLGGKCRLPDHYYLVEGAGQTEGWWSMSRIGCRGEPWTVAWDATFNMVLCALEERGLGERIVTLFPECTFVRFLCIEVLRRMGYGEAAERLHELALGLFDQAKPEHSGCDLARVYWATEHWHPKGYWALEQLAQRYGMKLFTRLLGVVPEKWPPPEIPQPYAWTSDQLIYYLSLAAGEDLFPWFAEIGTTVHPIPVIKTDDQRFKPAVLDTVVAAARKGKASDRLEALAHLSGLDEQQRGKLPRRVRELADGLRMADREDTRAAEVLGRIMGRKSAGQDAALAALQLAALGDPDALRRLPGLAAGEDTRFRLWSGYALSKAGREVGGLTLADIGSMDVQPYTELEIHARVEGYEVANVISEVGWMQFPHGNFASRFYVYWVHTSPQWRRMGISRELFAAAMAHPQARACSTFALSTGTRNVAHRMYAEFGFVDMARGQKHTRQLSGGPRCLPPDGVLVRAMREGEERQVLTFVAEVVAGGISDWPQAMTELGARDRVTMAFEDDRLAGVAVGAAASDGKGRLSAVCVRRDHTQRGCVGAALLTALHDRLAEDGAKSIELRSEPEDPFWAEVLGRSGYTVTPTGGVTMVGIRDLGQLFGETLPLYGKRMREGKCADWHGRVIIAGERLRAGLEVDGGEAAVASGRPRRGDIVVTAPDRVITRFVTGRETPMEGYLQTFAQVDPRPSSGVIQVIETLFPQVPWLNRETLG